ncbi:hypothetical protein PG993_012505 [Apiospora rasikravindrae]|uniref:Uncharacterized protein n=1 Tax=Apiospora rasikravindrae TaxID=990691 RepID=A0ABR1S4Z4_9PEZI
MSSITQSLVQYRRPSEEARIQNGEDQCETLGRRCQAQCGGPRETSKRLTAALTPDKLAKSLA